MEHTTAVKAEDYTESRQIPQLFESLLAGLMIHQPEDHLDFLIHRLNELKTNPRANLSWEIFLEGRELNTTVLPSIPQNPRDHPECEYAVAKAMPNSTDDAGKHYRIKTNHSQLSKDVKVGMAIEGNTIHSEETEPVQQRLVGVSIEFIRVLLAEHPDIVAENLTTSNINRRHIKKESAVINKAYLYLYAEKMDENGKPYVAPATVFISHAWRYCFAKEVADVMEQHAVEYPNAYFWFDLFTNDQNNVVNKDYEWFSATFRGAIKQIGKVLLIMSPWDNPKPLRRAWCLFEISSTLDMSADIEFEAKLPNSEIESLEKGVRKDPKCILQALADIQAEKAEAAVQADRDTIFAVIEKSEGGFSHINQQIKVFLRDWYQKTLSNLVAQTNSLDINLHGQVSFVMSNLGFPDQALEYAFKALDSVQTHLDEDHPDISTCYNNIGSLFRDKGELDKALAYSMKALQIHERTGLANENTATQLHNLGMVHSSKGDQNKALEYYEKALKIRLDKLGEKSRFTAESYNQIGMAYRELGDIDKALEYYLKALPIQVESLSENHSATAVLYVNIGVAYYSKGELDQALEYYFKALKVHKAVLGENHPNIATNYHNIGAVYFGQNNMDKALDYYLKALNIRQNVFGSQHMSIAVSSNNIGNIYQVKGDLNKALEYFLKDLQISQAIFGQSHPKLILCYDNLVAIYSAQANWAKVIESYDEQLLVVQTAGGENDPKVAEIFDAIGTGYFLKGEFEKALEYNLKTLTLREATLGTNHSGTLQSCKQISIIYLKLGMADKSEAFQLRSRTS